MSDSEFEMTCKASRIVRILDQLLTSGTSGMHRWERWRAIATAHGYPSIEQMRANRDALRRLGHLPVTFDLPRAQDCCGRRFDTPQALRAHRNRSLTHRQES